MRRRISKAGAVVEIPEVMGAVDVAGLARGIAQSSHAQEIEVEDIHDAPAKHLTISKGGSAVLRITLEASASRTSKTLAQNGTLHLPSPSPHPLN